MRATVDTLTGKKFRFNGAVQYAGYRVPQRCTARTCTVLHPDRVPEKLLRELNPGKPIPYRAPALER